MSGGQSTTKDCHICLETKSHRCFQVLDCGRCFCKTCLQQHAFASLDTARYPVRCPSSGCSEALTITDSRNSIFSRGSYRNLEYAKKIFKVQELAREAAVPPHLRAYCPSPECATFVPLTAARLASSTVRCPACRHRFCSSCKVAWHSNKTCEEYQEQREKDDLDMTTELADKNGWRRCNTCGQLVEKTGGCLHITCRCGSHWCYACGGSWQQCQSTCTRR